MTFQVKLADGTSSSYPDSASYRFRPDGILQIWDQQKYRYIAPTKWVEVAQTSEHHSEGASRRRDVWSGGGGQVYIGSSYREEDDPDLQK
ncbi:hypothetical protein [Mycobacterium sp. D16R24]|uniref:hypothetical protein n=1 Tax=Mycobacterium sp. D16R24 TaxID=1855656 RepID=UPI001116621D|nr:hypothetical protein [Mycobacterium sp. D16R24]